MKKLLSLALLASVAACDGETAPEPAAPPATEPAESAAAPAPAAPEPSSPELNNQLRGEMVGSVIVGCAEPYKIDTPEQLVDVSIIGREMSETTQVLTVPATLKADPANLKADLKVTYTLLDGAWKVSSIVAATCAPSTP